MPDNRRPWWRLRHDERDAFVFIGSLVGVGWLIWLIAGWPHRHYGWLWGTLVALGITIAMTASGVAQWRTEDRARAERRQDRLKTEQPCPLCAVGWVEKDHPGALTVDRLDADAVVNLIERTVQMLRARWNDLPESERQAFVRFRARVDGAGIPEGSHITAARSSQQTCASPTGDLR